MPLIPQSPPCLFLPLLSAFPFEGRQPHITPCLRTDTAPNKISLRNQPLETTVLGIITNWDPKRSGSYFSTNRVVSQAFLLILPAGCSDKSGRGAMLRGFLGSGRIPRGRGHQEGAVGTAGAAMETKHIYRGEHPGMEPEIIPGCGR